VRTEHRPRTGSTCTGGKNRNEKKYHLLRIFKQVTGHTPIDYINKVRCKYATQLLLNGASVTETALASGFSDAHYFSNCFKKYIGCRPSEIRKRTFENDI
jgi:AraC-like DNA-binding protein